MEMPPHMIHACDTEVADIDITKSPIGQGRVTCISLYSGPVPTMATGPATRCGWTRQTRRSSSRFGRFSSRAAPEGVAQLRLRSARAVESRARRQGAGRRHHAHGASVGRLAQGGTALRR